MSQVARACATEDQAIFLTLVHLTLEQDRAPRSSNANPDLFATTELYFGTSHKSASTGPSSPALFAELAGARSVPESSARLPK